MTEQYQTITLTETHEEIIVGTMEYPLMLAGIFYIKFIVYEKSYHNNEGFMKLGSLEPTKFITLLPQNILKRENMWSQEEEDIIKNAAEEARIRETTMKDYRNAAEAEMKKRTNEIQPHILDIENEDFDIDPDFATEIDLNDPNYL